MTRTSCERVAGALGKVPVLAAAVLLAQLAAASGCGIVRAQQRGAHPDFTGVWTSYREPGQPRIGRAPGALPFTPEASAKIEAYRALIEPTGETPGGYCLGTGMPGSMLGSGGYPMEIVQRPEEILIVYEAHTEVRHVYIGDRNMPEEDRLPDRNGYSSGHWEDDTLVVDTTHLKEQVDQRYAHSADARIVERYHLTRSDDGTPVLVAEMTMTDAAFYTDPVRAEKKWALVPNGHLLAYECNEPTWLDRLEELAREAERN